jgi:hypothetical protein
MTKPVMLTSALALAFALASCGNTPTGSNATSTLSPQSLAVSTAAAISDEAASATSSLTANNAMTDLSFESANLSSSSAGIGLQSIEVVPSGDRKPGFKPGGKLGEKCVTITPSPTLDSDADKVPDSATMTFDCLRDNAKYSFSRTGTVQISDPSSIIGEGGYDKTINLTEKRSNKLTGKTVTEVRTGERHPRRSGDKIIQDHDIKITRSVTDEADANIRNIWKLEFTASTPGSILNGSKLPAGKLSINGTHSVVRDGATRTSSPLTYDPTCDADTKYVAGSLKATRTGINSEGSLEIAYGACGSDPVVTKSGEAIKIKMPMPSK